MALDTELNELIINKLTKEKYDQLVAENKVNENEIYITDETTPTKLSELENDANFITSENVYTKSEVDDLILNAGDIDLTSYAKVEDVNKSLELKADKTEIPTKLSELENDEGYISEHQDISGKADKATTLAGYGIEDAYTKGEVDAKVSSVYRFRGSVDTLSSLPDTNLVIGDVYNVLDTGDNYAWDGESWDKLAGDIDLTPYLSKEEAQSLYVTTKSHEDSINVVNESLELKADKSELPTKLSELENDLDILPSQSNNAGKILMTTGEDTVWDYASVVKKGEEETGLSQLVINNVTQEEYNTLVNNNQINENELYVIDDEFTNEEIKSMLDTKASNEDLNNLKGRVENLELSVGNISLALDAINGEVI